MFRRPLLALALLALAGVLFATAGCVQQGEAPQTGMPGAGGALPKQIEREVGPAYSSPGLEAMVDRVGQRVVQRAGLTGGYHFYVLDQPAANAHAVSAGYVFVTRGLLSLLDDEAELAAAIAHELSHIMQKHASQREQARKKVLDAAIQATLASGSVTVGRSVARSGMADLRRYSREQELEADRLGLDYLVRAGYRGGAMTGLIEKLKRQSALEERLVGAAIEAGEQRGALSTHPAPDERLAALAVRREAQAPGESNAAAFLTALDGMSIDDRPEEGFVRGATFAHPTLRLAFAAPADFKLFNDSDGVVGVGADGSILYFSCSSERIEGRLDDWMRNELKPTPSEIQETEIDGAEAAIGARPRGSDTGVGQVRYVMVRHDPYICYFNLMGSGPDRDQRIERLVAATRSFRTLSEGEAAALKPYRLRVLERTAPAAQYAARLPYEDHRLLRLLTLNGVDDAAQFQKRTQIKIVEP